MISVDQMTVFRQYLALLPTASLACLAKNSGYDKLHNDGLVKTFILANLLKWNSLRMIEGGIRSQSEIQQELDVESFSAGQLSRRLAVLDTGELSHILFQLTDHYHRIMEGEKGLNPKVGKLAIIDSSAIPLSKHALDWTALTPHYCGVKIHLRLAIVKANSAFPEAMIPSTANVPDIEAVNHLIVDDDATYIADRGYGEKPKMAGWLERKVKFVVRVKSNFRVDTIQELPTDSEQVSRHALVTIRSRPDPVKLVEFNDRKGRHFRLISSRLDLSDLEIMEIYKNRWLIELFFKWLKQHVKVDHLYSQSPVGIWNQLYIALITFALMEIYRLLTYPNVTAAYFLRNIQLYLLQKWADARKEFERISEFTTQGRKSNLGYPKKARDYGADHAIVNPLSRTPVIK